MGIMSQRVKMCTMSVSACRVMSLTMDMQSFIRF